MLGNGYGTSNLHQPLLSNDYVNNNSCQVSVILRNKRTLLTWSERQPRNRTMRNGFLYGACSGLTSESEQQIWFSPEMRVDGTAQGGSSVSERSQRHRVSHWGVAAAEARGQFGNPEEGERPPLETWKPLLSNGNKCEWKPVNITRQSIIFTEPISGSVYIYTSTQKKWRATHTSYWSFKNSLSSEIRSRIINTSGLWDLKVYRKRKDSVMNYLDDAAKAINIAFVGWGSHAGSHECCHLRGYSAV
jgi:hypothetical protein